MKRYIRTADTLKPERALTFKYPEEYMDKGQMLCELFDQNGIKYVCYEDTWYGGYQFVVSRSGRSWNDIMKLINSVKSAKYDYKQTRFEKDGDGWVEVVDHVI